MTRDPAPPPRFVPPQSSEEALALDAERSTVFNQWINAERERRYDLASRLRRRLVTLGITCVLRSAVRPVGPGGRT